MILLLHENAKKTIKVISSTGEETDFYGKTCSSSLWELAEKFPNEWIGWCEHSLWPEINISAWNDIFHHDLIMASFAVKSSFLPNSIGYVDQLPFANVNRAVNYGTWLMSSDMGAIKGSTLIKFRPLLGEIRNFDYLLNSIAKLGQQNSLLCYSVPELYKEEDIKASSVEMETKATYSQLFSFVYQHYNSIWASILLLNLVIYERVFPLGGYLLCFFRKKFFKKYVELPVEYISSAKVKVESQTIDVIIPTIGRPEYLYKVLRDFANQTHLPQKIIIVEQNADTSARTELNYLQEENWPFEIKHLFIHQTGACNARNLALTFTTSNWVFFSDDDVRFGPDLITSSFKELKRLGIQELTISCLQPGEMKYFVLPKQWGTFGSGTSIVLRKFLENIKFSPEFENGYGEDMDFGMQLRNKGCDIIYHPHLEIIHLKAPIGGFRSKPKLEWEEEELQPKPSPTLMVFAKKHYSVKQLRGYKTSLYIRFYKDQSIKNPFSYLKLMNMRWAKSEKWAEKLICQNIELKEHYV